MCQWTTSKRCFITTRICLVALLKLDWIQCFSRVKLRCCWWSLHFKVMYSCCQWGWSSPVSSDGHPLTSCVDNMFGFFFFYTGHKIVQGHTEVRSNTVRHSNTWAICMHCAVFALCTASVWILMNVSQQLSTEETLCCVFSFSSVSYFADLKEGRKMFRLWEHSRLYIPAAMELWRAVELVTLMNYWVTSSFFLFFFEMQMNMSSFWTFPLCLHRSVSALCDCLKRTIRPLLHLMCHHYILGGVLALTRSYKCH